LTLWDFTAAFAGFTEIFPQVTVIVGKQLDIATISQTVTVALQT
jgi:hypothetical protein